MRLPTYNLMDTTGLCGAPRGWSGPVSLEAGSAPHEAPVKITLTFCEGSVLACAIDAIALLWKSPPASDTPPAGADREAVTCVPDPHRSVAASRANSCFSGRALFTLSPIELATARSLRAGEPGVDPHRHLAIVIVYCFIHPFCLALQL